MRVELHRLGRTGQGEVPRRAPLRGAGRLLHGLVPAHPDAARSTSTPPQDTSAVPSLATAGETSPTLRGSCAAARRAGADQVPWAVRSAAPGASIAVRTFTSVRALVSSQDSWTEPSGRAVSRTSRRFSGSVKLVGSRPAAPAGRSNTASPEPSVLRFLQDVHRTGSAHWRRPPIFSRPDYSPPNDRLIKESHA
ncbi:hypothetical protein M8Z33_33980 [Streptomyces sp. ZAF1911]|uniref:hypothetical protein n=1 Tax=Streptomyces sp. ZAF1911 TaxID=2944129 RepID=UPI00237A5F69|nr:hypothetical protein [Streptomyces sp. ZAF1911]MDD9381571.1 hypothetical protein [Streptomyces sp. ZAF1911]